MQFLRQLAVNIQYDLFSLVVKHVFVYFPSSVKGTHRLEKNKLQQFQNVILKRRQLAFDVVPKQRLFSEGTNTIRINPAHTKGFDHRTATVEFVVRNQLIISGDHRAQEVAEGYVNGGHVIESANAHVEYSLRRSGSFSCNAINEIRMKVSLRKCAGATGSDANKIIDTPLIRFVKAIEHGSNKDRTAIVRFDHCVFQF